MIPIHRYSNRPHTIVPPVAVMLPDTRVRALHRRVGQLRLILREVTDQARLAQLRADLRETERLLNGPALTLGLERFCV